jgi:hypothetical protein
MCVKNVSSSFRCNNAINAHLYNSASSYAVKPIRIQPIFMSITFHHYKQLERLSKEIEEVTGIGIGTSMPRNRLVITLIAKVVTLSEMVFPKEL